MKAGDTLYYIKDLEVEAGKVLLIKGKGYEIIEAEPVNNSDVRSILMTREFDDGHTHYSYVDNCPTYSFYVWEYFRDLNKIRKVAKKFIDG